MPIEGHLSSGPPAPKDCSLTPLQSVKASECDNGNSSKMLNNCKSVQAAPRQFHFEMWLQTYRLQPLKILYRRPMSDLKARLPVRARLGDIRMKRIILLILLLLVFTCGLQAEGKPNKIDKRLREQIA